ncbi:MAG TPA: glutathione S-transferase family protein [Candidatus Binataceae bacterium]|nr:glutathione S-transferase family protein [Candidatus Binataceae bacterium]
MKWRVAAARCYLKRNSWFLEVTAMLVLYTTERDYPWGTLRSTHASKTKVILEEKSLAYRIHNLPPGDLWKKPPEMLAKHPLGKVPYLEDGELVIFDSTVINEYLEDRYPKLRLMSVDPVSRMLVREAENFADEAILGGSLPLIWMPYWSEPAKRDTARMEKGRELLRSRDLPYLETLLSHADAGRYICGDFSLADAPLMALAMVLEVDAMPLDAFPRVERYLENLRARRSYRAISPRTEVAQASSSGPR